MKLFIWDFHGTLEKGTECVAFEITNRVLAERGYKERMDEALMHELYGRKWYEYFAHLLPHEPQETHVALQEQCIAFDTAHPEVVREIVRANDHIPEVLAAIAQRHDQVVISNTRHANLEEFLKATGLINFFPEGKYFGINNHHPSTHRSKKDVAEEYMDGKEFEGAVVIGDSPQDMIPVVDAVRYLYAHEGKAFKECEADYRIRDLREVLREI